MSSYYREVTVFTKLGDYTKFELSPEAKRDLKARMIAEVSKAVCKTLARGWVLGVVKNNQDFASVCSEQIEKEVEDMNYRLREVGYHKMNHHQLMWVNPLPLVARYSRVFDPYERMFGRLTSPWN